MPAVLPLPPVTLSIETPDTPADRLWITGWCLCFCWPMVDGRRLEDPWLWPEIGETTAAFATFTGDARREKMILQDTWIIGTSEGAPLRVRFDAREGALRCRVVLDGAFFARPWVQEQLGVHAKTCRLLCPTYTLEADVLAWLGQIRSAPESELLDAAGQVSYWHSGLFRQRLLSNPNSPAVARDRAWSEALIHSIIAEGSRIGWNPHKRIKADFLTDLDSILTPANQRSKRQRMVAPFPDWGR